MLSRLRDATGVLFRRRALAAQYRAVFDAPENRAVLVDLFTRAGVLSTSHEPGDPCQTAFNEGRRSMALEIIAQLRWTDGELLTLARARMHDQTQEDDL